MEIEHAVLRMLLLDTQLVKGLKHANDCIKVKKHWLRMLHENQEIVDKTNAIKAAETSIRFWTREFTSLLARLQESENYKEYCEMITKLNFRNEVFD